MKGTSDQGFKDYLTVYDSRFAKRVATPTEETTTRENKLGKEIHEVYYDFVEGIIKKIDKKETEYGWNLILEIDDVDEKNEVSITFYNSATRTILNKLCNVDFSKPAHLMVGKNDSGYTWFSIKQDGETVQNKYGKEDVPAAQKIKVKGKDTWQFDDQLDFLWTKAIKAFNDFQNTKDEDPDIDLGPAPVNEAAEDDLPF